MILQALASFNERDGLVLFNSFLQAKRGHSATRMCFSTNDDATVDEAAVVAASRLGGPALFSLEIVERLKRK